MIHQAPDTLVFSLWFHILKIYVQMPFNNLTDEKGVQHVSYSSRTDWFTLVQSFLQSSGTKGILSIVKFEILVIS